MGRSIQTYTVCGNRWGFTVLNAQSRICRPLCPPLLPLCRREFQFMLLPFLSHLQLFPHARESVPQSVPILPQGGGDNSVELLQTELTSTAALFSAHRSLPAGLSHLSQNLSDWPWHTTALSDSSNRDPSWLRERPLQDPAMP